MWSRSFGSETLASAGAGQPLAIGGPVRLFAGLVADHPVGFNVVFASAQLVIGAGLLLARDPRRLRVVCASSVAWALGIWVVGEGLGGLFGGHTSLSVGAPGAALLYLVLTVAARCLDCRMAVRCAAATAARPARRRRPRRPDRDGVDDVAPPAGRPRTPR